MRLTKEFSVNDSAQSRVLASESGPTRFRKNAQSSLTLSLESRTVNSHIHPRASTVDQRCPFRMRYCLYHDLRLSPND